MIIVLVTTKEKSLGTNFNQENWMLVIWLKSAVVYGAKLISNKDSSVSPIYIRKLGIYVSPYYIERGREVS